MREIAIVTNQLTANGILESWFIQNLVLQGVPFGMEWDIEGLRDSVVIYLELGEIDMNTIRTLKAANNRVVLCQLGDEYMKKFLPEAYHEADLIIRPYYFAEIFEDPQFSGKTIWVPNGYKSGVGPRQTHNLRKATKRRFISTFLGWLTNNGSFGDERAIFSKIAEANQSDILLQPTEYFGKGFQVGMYSSVMEHAIFAPCPAGNSPETIRLYDALEVGCIPISLKHEFLRSEQAMGTPPFPLLDSWEELPELLTHYRNSFATDQKSLLELQNACIEWWDLFKRNMSATIAKRLFDLRIQ